MGRIGSSSRSKHSKKKSLKVSPEARRKKKSRRNKSKKIHRHDDSYSSFSEDESTSSSLLSSSSSDGEYKSRRSRSRARKEVKGSKKRTRSRSLSEDSLSVKKRKGSKNSDSRKKNKKTKKKKKPKRVAYISSASSDSASCSTCKDGDSSGDEEGSRGRSKEKKKNHRDSKKDRDRNRKKRSKTRSSSPSKLSNSYDDEIIEEVPVENNPRRLKSVITIAKPPESEPTEEIVYDNDDYPSCKSNDSNELVDRFNISPEKKIPTSVIDEVNSPLSPNEKESNVSGNIGPEVDNLESILRQKALENLSKFRGGLKTKPVVAVVDKHKSDQSILKQPTSASVSMSPVSQPVVPRSRFTWRRDPAATTLKDEKAVANSGPESSGSQPAAAPKLQSAEKKIVNEKAVANSGSQPAAAPKLQSAEKKIVNEKPKNVANTNNTSGTGTNVDQKSTTALETPSASTKEGSSKGQQTESNDNSQFEKKTMSVMRGGEMVQVSYKVYIPQRAPALARRQLKR